MTTTGVLLRSTASYVRTSKGPSIASDKSKDAHSKVPVALTIDCALAASVEPTARLSLWLFHTAGVHGASKLVSNSSDVKPVTNRPEYIYLHRHMLHLSGKATWTISRYRQKGDSWVTMLFGKPDNIICFIQMMDSWVWKGLLTWTCLSCQGGTTLICQSMKAAIDGSDADLFLV